MPQELIIPVRFQNAGAAQDLHKIAQQGRQAGEETAKGFDKASRSAQGLGSEMAALMKAQVELGTVRQAADAVSTAFREVLDQVRETAKEFVQLRQALQQVAALKGVANTTQFTVEEAWKAAAAGLMPDEWRKAQEEFQSRAGAYLEGDQARLT